MNLPDNLSKYVCPSVCYARLVVTLTLPRVINVSSPPTHPLVSGGNPVPAAVGSPVVSEGDFCEGRK